jgi:hypothetical protein
MAPVVFRSPYGLRGTPSLVLLGRQGHIRLRCFGRIGDLALGSMIGRLLAEDPRSIAGGTTSRSEKAPALGHRSATTMLVRRHLDQHR